MGLTVHFSLRLPATFSTDEVKARIAALHQLIAKLPFQSQSAMVTLDEPRIRHALAPRNNSKWRWACIQYTRYHSYRHDSNGIPYTVDRPVPGTGACSRTVPAKHLIGFTCLPGDGCEPLNIFVGTYPNSILVDGGSPDRRLSSGNHRLMLTTPLAWTGESFTKTQYASMPDCGGVTNFMRCHLLVIAALDAAKEAGFEVEVRDEGGYWQDRNVPALVAAIGDWNAFILGIGQQLNAITPDQAAAPVDADLAKALGDDVIDLITRTKGTFTVMEPQVAAGS